MMPKQDLDFDGTFTTEYKYNSMSLSGVKPKTQVWDVFAKSSNDLLGVIQWFPQWRQYCFFPTSEWVFSKGCIADINAFIDQLHQERKTKQGKCL